MARINYHNPDCVTSGASCNDFKWLDTESAGRFQPRSEIGG
jgi:hypothetical protein